MCRSGAFSLSGSEAVHAALRAARVHTGRTRFVKFEGHYHGWFDNVAVSVSAPSADALGSRLRPRPLPWAQGRPLSSDAEVTTACWNDLDVVERVFASDPDAIAAVITEPVMCNSGCILPTEGFLEGLRSFCSFYGAVLIFDEVITGFRLGMVGAQGYFGVVPDLATFGKAMANGFPISALAGKAEVMAHVAEGRALHAGTMGEFKRSSQRLESEELRWKQGRFVGLIVRCGLRCGRLVVRRSGGVSIGSGFGKGLLVGCRARMLVWRLVCRLWLVRVGSARMAGWPLFLLSLFWGVICLLLSERRSLFSTPVTVGCVRSPAGWADHRRRSHVSCAATPQPVAEALSIGPRTRSGIRIGAPAV